MSPPKAVSSPKIRTKWSSLSAWMGHPLRTSWTMASASSAGTVGADLAVHVPSRCAVPGSKFIAAHSIQEFANVWIPLKTCFHIATLDHKRVKSIQLQVHVQWPQMARLRCRKGGETKDNTRTSVPADHKGLSGDLPTFHQAAGSYTHLCHWKTSMIATEMSPLPDRFDDNGRSEHCRHDLRLKPWDCWAVGAVEWVQQMPRGKEEGQTNNDQNVVLLWDSVRPSETQTCSMPFTYKQALLLEIASMPKDTHHYQLQ